MENIFANICRKVFDLENTYRMRFIWRSLLIRQQHDPIKFMNNETTPSTTYISIFCDSWLSKSTVDATKLVV